MIPTRLLARRGEKILPKFNALLDWIRTQRVIPQERVRVVETPAGTRVTVEDRIAVVEHPLQIRLQQGEEFFRVTNGNVNEESPVYWDEEEGKYLQVNPYVTIAGRNIRIPEHETGDTVYFFIVVRFRSKDFGMSSFSVFHASVEAFNRAMMLNQKINMKDISRGVPHANTGKGRAADCTGEFYIPIGMMRDGTVHQFTRHHISFRVYLDGERKRMAYWAA